MSRGDDYRAAVLACHVAARMLAEHDVEGFLRDIEHADAVGPVLDPTAYRQKSQAMHEDAEVLRASSPLAAIGRRVRT